MHNLLLYGVPMSPFVRKVEAVLHHLGVGYDVEMVNIMNMPDWFIDISPARRIPVLRDRSIGTDGSKGTIPDSSAIAQYLDRRFNSGLFGNDPYEAGRIAWYEEYADTVLAATVGMDLFRPIIFPLFRGNPPDLERARNTWTEKLPRLFDYLEASLDGGEYFVGDRFSMADIAISAQMCQIDLIVGLPDAKIWPSLVMHVERTKARPGFTENLFASAAALNAILPEKISLS